MNNIVWVYIFIFSLLFLSITIPLGIGLLIANLLDFVGWKYYFAVLCPVLIVNGWIWLFVYY